MDKDRGIQCTWGLLVRPSRFPAGWKLQLRFPKWCLLFRRRKRPPFSTCPHCVLSFRLMNESSHMIMLTQWRNSGRWSERNDFRCFECGWQGLISAWPYLSSETFLPIVFKKTLLCNLLQALCLMDTLWWKQVPSIDDTKIFEIFWASCRLCSWISGPVKPFAHAEKPLPAAGFVGDRELFSHWTRRASTRSAIIADWDEANNWSSQWGNVYDRDVSTCIDF